MAAPITMKAAKAVVMVTVKVTAFMTAANPTRRPNPNFRLAAAIPVAAELAVAGIAGAIRAAAMAAVGVAIERGESHYHCDPFDRGIQPAALWLYAQAD
jgi:hypothetical protein